MTTCPAQSEPPVIEVTTPTGNAGVSSLPGRFLELLATWQRRSAERARLARLDERLRRDAGLSEEAVAEELRKPFWRA